MGKPLIPGGYILLSKKIIDSEIFKKPPLYIKVWVYLLSIAQYKDFKQLKRGQCRTSIPEIQEACSWFVGYRKEVPTKDQIFQIIEWLRKPYESNCESNGSPIMITTTRATQGILVNIENYSLYQDSKNYESNEESNDDIDTKATREQRTPDNINKEDKEDKKNKKENKDIDNVQIENLWELYPRKKGKADAVKKLPKLIKDYTYEHIERCIRRYAEEVRNTEEKFIKTGSTFFNGGYMDYLDDNYKGVGKKNGGNGEDNGSPWKFKDSTEYTGTIYPDEDFI